MLKRNCPTCDKEIIYKNKRKCQQAIKNVSECRSCCKKGNKNPMFGLLEKDNPNYGQIRESIKGDNNPAKSKEVREKISNKNKGRTSSMKGKKHSKESIEKIRLSNIGKSKSPEAILKIKEARKKQVGDKCPGWKGGVTPVVRKMRNSKEYSIWRNSIFERDNYTCKICKVRNKYLEAHHVIGVYEKIDLIFELSNGITMCKDCHLLFHNKYGRKNFPNITELYSLTFE
jgi:hypothetical protein